MRISDTLIKVEGVSKKFCRSLKRSLWYGMQDLGSELRGRRHGRNGALRLQEFWAIRDTTFSVRRGETLGLIGPNGAGKTTLLRMLNGLIKPDQGRIEIRGRMQALIALGAGFNPVLTGRENIFVNASVLGVSKHDVARRFDDIVAFSGIPEFIDAPVQSYSSGMAVRLGFAVAAHLDPEILLVDEVLAVGDEGFQARCLNKIGELKDGGTAIILVSHNMHTISTFSSRVMLLKPGGFEIFTEVSDGVMAYKRLFQGEAATDIEKITTGTPEWKVLNVVHSAQVMEPGASFEMTIDYCAARHFADVEVDVTLRSNNDAGCHYQATNRAYGQVIDFGQGEGRFRFRLEGIRLNNAGGLIAVAIWEKGRKHQLFWWRIPVQFLGRSYSVGGVFYEASFEIVSAVTPMTHA